MNELHRLMDEKIDVYAENEKFALLLEEYYKTYDEKLIKEMWPIAFRCSANILKKRFGNRLGWEDISERSIDMCEIIFNRIMNKTGRFPNGYKIDNLPTVLKYTVLNVFYGPEKKKQEKEDSWESLEELRNI